MDNIQALISGCGTELYNIFCFDPSVILERFHRKFPTIDLAPREIAWRDYQAFRRMAEEEDESGKNTAGAEGAMRIARADALRRGPIWIFGFDGTGADQIRGKFERYAATFWSKSPIPEPLRSQLLTFLEELRFAEYVLVGSDVDCYDDDDIDPQDNLGWGI